MIKLFPFFLILLSLGETANPGVSVAISQDGLNYVGSKIVDSLYNKVKNSKLPNVSGKKMFEYKIDDIEVTKFVKPNVDVTLNPGDGFIMKLNNGEVRVDGKWEVKFLFSPKKGTFFASSSNIGLEMGVSIKEPNGKPVLKALSCKASLENFNIETTGSKLSWLLNIIVKVVKGMVRSEIEGVICDKLSDVINKNSNKELDTFNLITPITDDVKLDYHLTKDPVITSSYLALFLKGKFIDDPQSSFNPSEMSFLLGKMVSTSISENTLNSLARVLHEKNLIDFEFKLEEENFLGMLFFYLVDDAHFKFRLLSSEAPIVRIENGKVKIDAPLVLNISNPTLFAGIGVKVSAYGNVFISENRLKGKLDGVNTTVTSMKSNLDDPLNETDASEFVNISIPFFLPKINAYLDKGIPLPTIQQATFHNHQIKMADNHIQVAFNVKP